MIPVWAKPAAIGVAIGLVLLLGWIWWPAPGPSPAEKALERQAETEKATAEAAKARVAELEAENAELRSQIDAELNKIPEVRERRRSVRTATRARVEEVSRTADADAGRVLVEQHERTRSAIERFRSSRDDDGNADGSARPANP